MHADRLWNTDGRYRVLYFAMSAPLKTKGKIRPGHRHAYQYQKPEYSSALANVMTHK